MTEYHKENKDFTLELLLGNLKLSVSKGNSGLHIREDLLSIIVDSLDMRPSLSGPNHYVIMFLKGDSFVGCLDIYDFETLTKLNDFFPINGFKGLKNVN